MIKDIAWKYGTKVEGTAKNLTYVKCKFCDKICKGGITRLKNHLAGTHENVDECRKVSNEVKQEMRRSLELAKKSKQVRERNMSERVETGSYYASASATAAGNSTESQRGVRGPIDRFVIDLDENNDGSAPNTAFGPDARKAVCQDIGRFFYECAVPFNIACNPAFINMCRSLGNYGRGLSLPTPYELSTWILEEEEKTTETFVEEVKKTWTHTGVTIMSDGWKDIRGRQLINFLVNNPYGTVFLKSIDASDVVKDANLIFKLIDDVVEEVGPDLVVQVVSDNASNYKAAGNLLMNKRPSMFWTPCAAHCIDLMLEKIGELPQHKNALINAKKVCNFIYNHGWVLALMRKHARKELIRAAATRFATAYLTLQSMQDVKDSLETMFSCREWQVSSWSKSSTGKDVKRIIQSNRFWKGVDYAIKTTKPLVSVLRMTDSEKVPGMGFLYGAMDKAKEEIAKNLNNKIESYKEIWDIIDEKWDFQMHRDLHAAAYYLNPHFRFDDDFSTAFEVRKGLYTCMDRLITNPNEREKANLQIDKYDRSEGLFGFREAKATRKKRAPAEWWNAFGDETPELKSFAVRVLSLTCSSSACERNWSTFNQIHTKRRNRLTAKKLNTLAYIMYNKKLKDKHIKKLQLKDDEDPLVYDHVPSDDEWVVAEDERRETNDSRGDNDVLLLQCEAELNIDDESGGSLRHRKKRKTHPAYGAQDKGKSRLELIDEEIDIEDVDSGSEDNCSVGSDDSDADDGGDKNAYYNSDFHSSFVPLDTMDSLLN